MSGQHLDDLPDASHRFVFAQDSEQFKDARPDSPPGGGDAERMDDVGCLESFDLGKLPHTGLERRHVKRLHSLQQCSQLWQERGHVIFSQRLLDRIWVVGDFLGKEEAAVRDDI